MKAFGNYFELYYTFLTAFTWRIGMLNCHRVVRTSYHVRVSVLSPAYLTIEVGSMPVHSSLAMAFIDSGVRTVTCNMRNHSKSSRKYFFLTRPSKDTTSLVKIP